jgi:hypothetical protein
MAPSQLENSLVARYVNVPCPSGLHERSLVTFRNHTVAVMFSVPVNGRGRNPRPIPKFTRLESTGRGNPLNRLAWVPPTD